MLIYFSSRGCVRDIRLLISTFIFIINNQRMDPGGIIQYNNKLIEKKYILNKFNYIYRIMYIYLEYIQIFMF